MDLPIFVRGLAVVALGIAAIAAIQAVARHSRDEAGGFVGRDTWTVPSASAALKRCNDLGLAAATDDACRSLWMEHRHRFLAPAKSEVVPGVTP